MSGSTAPRIPEALTERDQWVLWRYEKRGGKLTKVPYQTDRTRASSTDSATWRSFRGVHDVLSRDSWFNGIGFVFGPDDPFVGIDLDNCLEQGTLKRWAVAIVERFADTYMEVSPSGNGIKIFAKGRLTGQGKRKAVEDHAIEVYDRGRFFTVTSIHFNGAPLQIIDHQSDIDRLYRLISGRPEPPVPTGVANKIPKGHRHDTLVSLAGTMRKRDMSVDAIDAALWAENCARCEPPYDRQHVRRIAESAGGWNVEARLGPAQSDPNEWRKPEPIQSELPPVQTFTEDLLPISLRPLVRDVADRMQVPMDYPAIVVVLCLAGVVNRRAVIQPKANDTAWVVVLNLWGGIIAPPGFMKSPVIQATTRPLNQIQTEWRCEHEEALKDYAREKEEYELRWTAWKEQYKAASKRKGSTAPERPADKPEEPKLRRLIVNDATFEALHQTMSENAAGILVIRDELTGWWSQLDRAGREGERAFCLQAWNGDTGHTIDRIGRGTIHVPACCMSMLGGIQPGRLRSYLVDALEDGPSNDGLIQRFQLLVWPDTASDWNYVDRAPDAASEQQAARVFRKLVELDAENPMRLRFASDAQELFIEWLAELEAKIRGDEIHPALVSHLSKYRSLMPTLAALFHLAETAAGNIDAGTVSLHHTQQAAAWCDYLESHARRVYSCIVTPQVRAARELADKIKHRKVGTDGFFSCRDVYLKGWKSLDSPEAVKLAAQILEDAGWLRDVSSGTGPAGGRPSNRYEINPGVWK